MSEPTANADPANVDSISADSTNERPALEKPSSAKSGRFSLQNLSAAFARLTGTSEPQSSTDDVAETLEELQDSAGSVQSEVLSPQMIVEGMLFVGNSDGRPLTSREMATPIRDVSPREVETLIDELNDAYAQTNTAYRIVSEGNGFRFALAKEYDFVRQRFHGPVREAKLTPQVIEVLSIVAYRQPINADEITELRGDRSTALISQLVRRGLLRLERPKSSPRKPNYHTTDRFNTLFRISSPQDLPNSEDLDDF